MQIAKQSPDGSVRCYCRWLLHPGREHTPVKFDMDEVIQKRPGSSSLTIASSLANRADCTAGEPGAGFVFGGCCSTGYNSFPPFQKSSDLPQTEFVSIRCCWNGCESSVATRRKDSRVWPKHLDHVSRAVEVDAVVLRPVERT